MDLDKQVFPLKIRFAKIVSLVLFLGAVALLYPQLKNFRHLNLQTSNEVVAPAVEETAFSRAEIFKQTIRYLGKNYYDTKALDPRALLKEALLGISRNVPEILVQFPDKAHSFTLEVAGSKKEISLPNMDNLDDLMPIVQEVFAFIQTHYHGDIEYDEMQYAAINGMLDSLDPHSSLLPPKIFNEFKTQTEGEFGGIGIVIGMKDGEITVIAPLPDTPAGRAGLRPKDKIIKIGEEASINMNLNEAVERLRGKVGTQVSITIAREGVDNPMEFNLTRAKIKIESVQSRLLTDPAGDIGILRVKSFQEETMRELTRHLKAMEAKSKNFKGLILDLRNNPGGLLNQAIDMSNEFLEKGTIVITVGANNQVLEVDEANGSGKEESYPIVVIVNDGSASASEIVSGALKNNNRAVIIGSQTFGKGSVQSVYSMKDGSALKLTVAQYLTPGNQSIQTVGITPDIKLIPESVQKDKVDLVESEGFGEKDLEKHLESSLKVNAKPYYTMGFYLPDPPKPDENQSYSNEIEVDKDYEIQLASQILRSVKSSKREDMLAQAKDLLESSHSKEDVKLKDALNGIGIDWSLEPSPEKPVAAVTFNILSTAGQALKAGEEGKLELKVHNVGKGAFHQLVATTDSDNFLLKNREFIFGKIAPGETRTWSVPIKLPASSYRREDKVTFNFREGNDLVPEKFQSVVATEPLAHPFYSYQYQLFDDGQFGSKGNGNKVPDLGEKVVLKLKVQNKGPGLGKDSVVNLKNLDGEGIFISQGREKLGEMPPGSEKDATLSFVVEPHFEKKKLDMELSVTDMETQENLTDKFIFPIGTGDVKPQPNIFAASPTITLKQEPFPSKTSQKKVEVSGKVSDLKGLKDVSVYVGDYKAYLKSFGDGPASNPPKEADFEASLPLKEKSSNLITILARNQNDLISRQNFYILQE